MDVESYKNYNYNIASAQFPARMNTIEEKAAYLNDIADAAYRKAIELIPITANKLKNCPIRRDIQFIYVLRQPLALRNISNLRTNLLVQLFNCSLNLYEDESKEPVPIKDRYVKFEGLPSHCIFANGIKKDLPKNITLGYILNTLLRYRHLGEIDLRDQVSWDDLSHQNDYIRNVAESSVKCGIGNCDEYHTVIQELLMEIEFNRYNDIIEGVSLINEDHIFTLIGRNPEGDINDPYTWGDTCFTIDPWEEMVGNTKNYLDYFLKHSGNMVLRSRKIIGEAYGDIKNKNLIFLRDMHPRESKAEAIPWVNSEQHDLERYQQHVEQIHEIAYETRAVVSQLVPRPDLETKITNDSFMETFSNYDCIMEKAMTVINNCNGDVRECSFLVSALLLETDKNFHNVIHFETIILPNESNRIFTLIGRNPPSDDFTNISDVIDPKKWGKACVFIDYSEWKIGKTCEHLNEFMQYNWENAICKSAIVGQAYQKRNKKISAKRKVSGVVIDEDTVKKFPKREDAVHVTGHSDAELL